MLLVGRQEGHPACKKHKEWWGAGVVVCLEQGADLHIAQLMPLPPTVSCFSKIQIGFTFLVPAHLGSPGQRAVKWVCVCACLLLWALAGTDGHRTISQTLLSTQKNRNPATYDAAISQAAETCIGTKITSIPTHFHPLPVPIQFPFHPHPSPQKN